MPKNITHIKIIIVFKKKTTCFTPSTNIVVFSPFFPGNCHAISTTFFFIIQMMDPSQIGSSHTQLILCHRQWSAHREHTFYESSLDIKWTCNLPSCICPTMPTFRIAFNSVVCNGQHQILTFCGRKTPEAMTTAGWWPYVLYIYIYMDVAKTATSRPHFQSPCV